MGYEFYLTQNDTGPSMVATLIDENDAAYDLSGLTVTFQGTKPDGTSFTKTVTKTDETNGIVRVDWDASDTADAGVIEYTFGLTNGETVPNDRTYRMLVNEDN